MLIDSIDALKRIFDLLKPSGVAFVSLRLGPDSAKRGMFKVSSREFVQQAKKVGFELKPVGDYADLLGRSEISWKMFELKQ